MNTSQRQRRAAAWLVLLLSVATPVAADTILVFGQNGGGNLVSGNEVLGTTVLSATNVPLTITTLHEGGVNLTAFFNFDAVNTAPAQNVGGSLWTQPYTGDFQITGQVNGAGFNYLSGTFDGVALGIVDGHTMVFGSAQPPLALSFTSDVPGLPLRLDRAMALSFTNALPSVSIAPSGSFNDFTSNVAGNFSAVPEPGTLALLGSGVAGLYARHRRRQKHGAV